MLPVARLTGPKPSRSPAALAPTSTTNQLAECRHADDCNIYVRSHRAGERVMASVSRFLTTKLRLKVNETKSAVARPEERKFLGIQPLE